jgi:hypothetical protein
VVRTHGGGSAAGRVSAAAADRNERGERVSAVP